MILPIRDAMKRTENCAGDPVNLCILKGLFREIEIGQRKYMFG
jgi:hypothetical protein